MSTVQFRTPLYEVTEFTDIGTGIQRRCPAWSRPPSVSLRAVQLMAIRAQLARGPFLAGFDAGLCDLRDAAPKGIDRVRLATWVF